eukprot:CAMPEP_0168351436 /NCGR_PEP_ID=MMETSP0213-20121227/21865_1 /TAXON_ID=151035 /ORGANISM="Euplotes harpa, Strain FSP1.4" /LENGTH=42 /DNA_ID= /DNA_START= /DNA_END= /DNA_ORIENTATION=
MKYYKFDPKPTSLSCFKLKDGSKIRALYIEILKNYLYKLFIS